MIQTILYKGKIIIPSSTCSPTYSPCSSTFSPCSSTFSPKSYPSSHKKDMFYKISKGKLVFP